MLKVILGSALGGLVAGGIALFAAAPAAATQPRSAFAEPIAPMVAEVATPTVQCAAQEQAVMARVLVNGREATTLACVPRSSEELADYWRAQAIAAAPQGYAQPVTYAAVPAPLAAPATLTAPMPAARRVAYRDQDDTVRYEPDRRKRSVAKTAMIIGGSAGAGAGVGALAGGKKGALIGAAIGGGAASIFEATKR